MKKLTAILLAVIMVVSLCSVFTFAASENLALNKTVTGAVPSTHASNANYGGSLTDGKAAEGSAIGTAGEWFCYYYNPDADPSTWNIEDPDTKTANAVIDLGEVCTVENVRVHVFTGNHWGIIAPESITAYVSEDGVKYSEVGFKTYEKITSELMQEEWSEFVLDAPAAARYVKLKVVLMGYFAFLNEVEVIGTKGAPTNTVTVEEVINFDGKLDDTGYDKAAWLSNALWQGKAETDPQPDIDASYTIRTDDEYVYIAVKVDDSWQYKNFDPDTLDGTLPVGYQTGATNFRIWFLGDKGENGQFFDVTLKSDKKSFATYLAKAATDAISVAADTSAKTISAEFKVAKSTLKAENGLKLMVTYSGPYVTDGTNTAYNAYHLTPCTEMPASWWSNTDAYKEWKFVDTALGTYEVISEEPVVTEPVIGEKIPMWLTNINDFTEGTEGGEGSGVICTTEDIGGGWFLHFAFSPVAGLENVYELSAIDTTPNGEAQKLEVPKGGFVYLLNLGNDYPSLGAGWEGKPNLSPVEVQNMIALAKTWNVGDIFLIENIDSIPAENDGKKYWEGDWKVNATIATYVPGTGAPSEPEFDPSVLGEANENPSCTVEVTAPATYKAGSNVKVAVNLKDVAGDGISVLKLKLCYDASKVAPVVSLDDNGGIALLAKAPESWKSDCVCKIVEEDGQTYLDLTYFSDVEDLEDLELVKDGDLTIEVEFKVLDNADGYLAFYVAHDSVKTTAENLTVEAVGNGSYAVTNKAAGSTGDAGVVALVILAVVAAFGSAVVVKSRR